jgi:acetyl-CoA/propionyl-CoA carboxylase biotin carboxyl carrier protein
VAADGTISFLEVNTRLQVEHPVTEEVSGIDLVREMFRIADGEPLGYHDPPLRGHSIEFRINAEDPGQGFLPTPGTVTGWYPPCGPGVRLDAGVETGTVIGPAWDSLLGKLIVTGATREQALRRAARALAEFRVEGLATALPFHRAVVTDPAFAPETHGIPGPFTVHTRWIETEFRNNIPHSQTANGGSQPDRETIVVEVDGKRIEVTLPAGPGIGIAVAAGRPAPAALRRPGQRTGAAPSGDTLTAPMQGTIVKIAVSDGDQVAPGDLVVVLEAMKMEQPINAHKAGTVTGLTASPGGTLASGTAICQITD